MKHNLNDNLRLEIEVPPTGLPNLIKNPTGEKGSWFWLTPVDGTSITPDWDESFGHVLTMYTQPSQAAYWTTEFMPMSAGRYVGGRFTVAWNDTNVNMKPRFEFYDSNKTFISASTQGPAASGYNTTHYISAVQAPANTAHVKLRFDMYNGTGNPGVDDYIVYTDVMVTHAATAGEIGEVRRNLVKNPSWANDMNGWTYQENIAAWGVAGEGLFGSTCAFYTMGQANVRCLVQTAEPDMPVQAGLDYTFSIYARDGLGDGSIPEFLVSIHWIGSNGKEVAYVSSPSGTGTANVNNSWKRFSVTGTAPSNATTAVVRFRWTTPYANSTVIVDGALFEASSTVRPYFDGSSANVGGKTHAWTGTAHASASTQTANQTAYAFVEPYEYRNLLGSSAEISVERSELDAGLLSATIYDATLDPTVNNTMAPDKKIRLRALVNDVWESVFEGSVSQIDVTYDKKKIAGSSLSDPKAINIHIVAEDAVSQLANQSESRGVENVDDIRYTMEGKGVPWNVNGSGGQQIWAQVVSLNDNASMLDQIAITRDTNLAYAWVDRRNILNIHDNNNLPWSETFLVTDTGDVTIQPPNESFEDSMDGWYETSNDALFRSTDHAVHGQYALACPMNNWTDADIMSPLYPAEPGRLYKATFAALSNQTVSAIYADLFFYDVNETQIGSVVIGPDPSSMSVGTWTDYTISGTSPAGTAFVRLHLYFYPNTGAQTLWIDDIRWAPIVNHSYSDIDATFSSGDLINHVTVKWLRPTVDGTGSEEIDYGPYVDQTSIDRWGARSRTFTVHGANENAASIEAYAQSILTANANPVARVDSLTIPVNEYSLGLAVFVDLYSNLKVTYDTKFTEEPFRVTGIQHNITPYGWFVTYTFADTGSVAVPRTTPSPPAPPVGKPWLQLGWSGANNGWPHATWKAIPWDQVKYAAGDWQFIAGINAQITIPETGWYDVHLNLLWAQDGLGGDRVVSTEYGANGERLYHVTDATGTGNFNPTTAISQRMYYTKGTVLYTNAFATLASGLTTTLNPSVANRWTIIKVQD